MNDLELAADWQLSALLMRLSGQLDGMGLPMTASICTEAGLRLAQGTEAGTAETPKSGSVHDGPVAESDAPEGSPDLMERDGE